MRIRLLALALTAASAALPASAATTITFTELGLPNLTPVTNQYAAFGITAANFYQYSDPRDTFDGQGIALDGSSGTITFTGIVSAVSFDLLVVPDSPLSVSLLDSGSNLLETFDFPPSGPEATGSHAFTATGVKFFVVEGVDGRVGISTLRFTGGVIPEPASWALLIAGFGLVGTALRRQRLAAA